MRRSRWNFVRPVITYQFKGSTMRKKISVLQFIALALVTTMSRQAVSQGLDAQGTVALMNAANIRITNDLAVILERCANQANRTKILQEEQNRRVSAAAGITVQLNSLKAELDGRLKALTAAQNSLSGIDALTTTLRAKIANFAKPSEQEKVFLKQLADNKAKKLKAQRDLVNADKQFNEWKNTGNNEVALLQALLASVKGTELSASQKEKLAVLNNYDKAANDLAKIVSDSDAAIDAATTALARLEATDQADKATLIKSLNEQIAARPAARAAVATAQAKVAETNGAYWALHAKVSLLSNITIPKIHPICAKLGS